jgi:tetratricopeptide (TPR) repeat protein
MAIGLLVAALNQERVPYPYNLKRPTTAPQAFAQINSYPGEARAHQLLSIMMSDTGSSAERLEELRAAIWLEPTNPISRDLYVRALLERNAVASAQKEIARSVANSPTLSNHPYLNVRIIPWLSQAERQAIEEGFDFAINHHYEGAIENFAHYYEAQGNFKAEGALFEGAARTAKRGQQRTTYLDDAGSAYARDRSWSQAESAFRSAIAIAPADAEAYMRLIRDVLAPQRELDKADSLVAQGIRQGADPYKLYSALAAAAQTAEDYTNARSALQHVLDIRGDDFDAVIRLGRLELGNDHPDRAALWLRRATLLDPKSVEAFVDLGSAEENAYEYFAADQAYRQALRLAPTDISLKTRYDTFRQKIEGPGGGARPLTRRAADEREEGSALR